MPVPAPPMSDSTLIIAVVGDAIMDLCYECERVPERGESFDASSLVYKPGGKGSNTAVAIYRGSLTGPAEMALPDVSTKTPARVEVYLNTAVGDDHFGRESIENLEFNGVNTSGVSVLPTSQTGTCAVFVEFSIRSSRDIGFPGANAGWRPKDPDSVTCLTGGNRPDLIVAHLENDLKVIEDVLAVAHANAVETLLNPSLTYPLHEDTYKNVTHLVLNNFEVAQLTGLSRELPTEAAMLQACTYFMHRGVRNVVITLGARGAFYATEGAPGLVEAQEVQQKDIRDSTGAGDTFVGTYALEYVRQKRSNHPWNIRKAVGWGCRAAAKTLQQVGAQDAIPWADEIDFGYDAR